MTDIEYRILEKIYTSVSHHCPWIDVINAFDPQSNCTTIDGVLHSLVDAKLVHSDALSRNDRVHSCVSLSNEGLIALLAEREKRQADSIAEGQKKDDHDYRVRKETREKLTLYLAVFSTIISVCALIVSIIHS